LKLFSLEEEKNFTRCEKSNTIYVLAIMPNSKNWNFWPWAYYDHGTINKTMMWRMVHTFHHGRDICLGRKLALNEFEEYKFHTANEMAWHAPGRVQVEKVILGFIGLALVGKDIVFRFIIEYSSSLRDFYKPLGNK
jgi:hypothetical protein